MAFGGSAELGHEPPTPGRLPQARAERRDGHARPVRRDPSIARRVREWRPRPARGLSPPRPDDPRHSARAARTPEAQMDRFAVHLSLGYVAPEDEMAILTAQAERHPIDTLTACVSIDDVLMVRRRAAAVRMSDELKRYAVDVVRATRAANGVQLGASPRASLALMKAAQALALSDGREFVIPEDVREMAVPVIAHRMVVEPQARFAGVTTAGIVEEILTKVPMPS